ncbi:hypothetical protein LXL04_011803 [Taraxacum kok-saghyz]
MSQWPITSKQNSAAMAVPSQDSAKAALSGWDDGRGAVIRGDDADDGGIPWSPSIWNLRNVGGSPDESIQVELISTSLEDKIDHSDLAVSTPEASYAVGLERANYFVRPQFNEEARSPDVKKFKTIIHPGEVCIYLFTYTNSFMLIF